MALVTPPPVELASDELMFALGTLREVLHGRGELLPPRPRERLKSAKADWTAAVADADTLLYRRQQGGA
jgi:hypothetical protein